jgi:hypothetical protein
LRPNEASICGYCGENFRYSKSELPVGMPTEQEWKVRIGHLQEIHRFGECNHDMEFFRVDRFGHHLKHSHAATSRRWTNVLENACRKDEPLPEPQGLEKILESEDTDLEWLNNPQAIVDEIDVTTFFSKDSGYSSMASKAHRPTHDDGQGMSNSAKWEFESVDSSGIYLAFSRNSHSGPGEKHETT